MAQTTLNVRMDEDIKKDFDAFCSRVGLNTSVAVNMFARAVLRERRIPFEISDETDLFYDDNNMAALHVSETPPRMSREAVFGCMRGKFKMADDFDAPLEDFREYME